MVPFFCVVVLLRRYLNLFEINWLFWYSVLWSQLDNFGERMIQLHCLAYHNSRRNRKEIRQCFPLKNRITLCFSTEQESSV